MHAIKSGPAHSRQHKSSRAQILALYAQSMTLHAGWLTGSVVFVNIIRAAQGVEMQVLLSGHRCRCRCAPLGRLFSVLAAA